ncbi:MAG: hypothetical protein M1834_002057 [Cirrosporium novae-zelandiae]|nr:MAG: hypothetical protein M1834_002057 [Cirrosporium novae-zelandiae]
MPLLEFIFLLATFAASACGKCYTPGPAFPVPNLSARYPSIETVTDKLDKAVNDILSSSEAWNRSTTSFSIQLASAKESLWSFYHTAPIQGRSDPLAVTGDTVFRIASISKTFTVYSILLQNGIHLDDPITKYLPDLAEEKNPFPYYPEWNQITIWSLASQLSGISRETGQEDLSSDKSLLADPLASGFPPLFDQELPPCQKNSSDRACTAEDVIETAKNRPRVFATNERSTYSNVAFVLLGLALENATGQTFPEIVTSSILTPLGMENTTITKPDDSVGNIPIGSNDWYRDLGVDASTGGIYSSANDLSKYLRSILSSTLLPQATTNAWMKPHSWTISGTESSTGMPWEMFRTTKLTRDGRAVDIITKGGSLNGYRSTIALVLEFGLGLTILVASPDEEAGGAINDLRENLIATLIPAVEEIVRADVRSNYAGWYGALVDFFKPLNPNWHVKISVDNMGPGLKIDEWISNGTDFLTVYGGLKGMPKDLSKWEARLLPTGIVRDGDKLDYEETWRVVTIQKKNWEDQPKIFADFCVTDVDVLMYGGYPLEEFVFKKREQDDKPTVNVVAMILGGLRRVLFKGEEGSEDYAREDGNMEIMENMKVLKALG